MTVFVWILFIVLIISSIAMIAIVLMQDTKSSGLGSGLGSVSNAESFFGRNRSKTREGRLMFQTKILACVIAVISLGLVLIFQFYYVI